MESLHQILLAICGLLYITITTALPDLRHVPYTPRSLAPAPINGLCYNYTIQAADTCPGLAGKYEITVAEIETWNTANYGWKGCNGIKQGDFVCLSPGAPPMPVALPHAICGPQVPGTARPSDYSVLASLNPCPSSQCCTAEGHCSTNSETCTSTSCIANCGPKTPAQPAPVPAPKETTKTVLTKTTTTFDTTTTRTTTEPSLATTDAASIITDGTTSTVSARPASKEIPPPQAPQGQATWRVTGYLGWHCNRDYFVVEGHQASNWTCLELRSLSSEYTDSGVWCRYYTDGGFSSTSCDQIPHDGDEDDLIFSWGMNGATSCQAFADPQCDASLIQKTIYDVGEATCEAETLNRPHLLIDWVALRCAL